MGSPQKPTLAQYSELEQPGQLQTVSAPGPIAPQGGKAKVSLSLPLHGVSPIQLTS
jgi:xylan 1,4-beta-xylosidase